MATYGPEALRTFAHVLAGVTGNRVDVRVRGSRAYTDGEVVVLPDRGVWEEDGFRALCGDAVHEVAYVFFGSNRALHEMLATPAGVEVALTQQCFNAVINVADETRMLRLFPKATVLLDYSSEAALRSAVAAGAIPRRPPSDPTTWQLLAAGIWLTRSEPGSEPRRALRGWRTRVAGMGDVIRILARARGRKRAGFTPERTPREWRRIQELTRVLIELLQQLSPSRPREESNDDAGDAGAADLLGRWRRAARDALLEEGADAEAGGEVADRDEWTDAVAGRPEGDPRGDDVEDKVDDDLDSDDDWMPDDELEDGPIDYFYSRT